MRSVDPVGLASSGNWLDEPILGPGSETTGHFLRVTADAGLSTVTNGEYQPPQDIACDPLFGLMKLVTGLLWTDLLIFGTDGLAAPEVLEMEEGEWTERIEAVLARIAGLSTSRGWTAAELLLLLRRTYA